MPRGRGVVRRADLEQASATRGSPATRARSRRGALAGDAQADDRVHELVGTILAERGEGGPARLVVRRVGADRETRGDTHAILATWVVPCFSIPAHRANR